MRRLADHARRAWSRRESVPDTIRPRAPTVWAGPPPCQAYAEAELRHTLARRRAEALTGLDLAGKSAVEVGPLDRPIAMPDTARVWYADHCSSAELLAKYAGDPGVDVASIPPVDIDLSRTTLTEAAATGGPFDLIVASHVIEHVPDLIDWLCDASGALNRRGVIALMVPDKRFTFDLHRRLSSWRDVETAHTERRDRPSLETVLDHFLQASRADAGELWHEYRTAADAPRLLGADAATSLATRWSAGEYIDAHCWVWTPWTFVELLGRVVENYAPELRLLRAEPTPAYQLDFWVQLVKAPRAEATDWTREAHRLRSRSPRPELASF